MQIVYLADHPQFIPTLADWHYREWGGYKPDESLEDRTERLRGCCGRSEIPIVAVAVDDNELLGSAMLIAHDMDTRLDLSPWLAGVFVSPPHRKTGIGSALVQRIVDEARLLRVARLYLYTHTAERFYARHGWELLEHAAFRGANVTIMYLDLATNGYSSPA